MIQPLKAIAGKSMVSNPYALNPQRAYQNTMNSAQRGEKLNINCNDTRSVSLHGKKLDIMA